MYNPSLPRDPAAISKCTKLMWHEMEQKLVSSHSCNHEWKKTSLQGFKGYMYTCTFYPSGQDVQLQL